MATEPISRAAFAAAQVKHLECPHRGKDTCLGQGVCPTAVLLVKHTRQEATSYLELLQLQHDAFSRPGPCFGQCQGCIHLGDNGGNDLTGQLVCKAGCSLVDMQLFHRHCLNYHQKPQDELMARLTGNRPCCPQPACEGSTWDGYDCQGCGSHCQGCLYRRNADYRARGGK
jgi:hypothetical protein